MLVECIGLIFGAEREINKFWGKAWVCLQAFAGQDAHTPRAAETAEEENIKGNMAPDFRV